METADCKPGRYSVRYHFDRDDFAEQCIPATSASAATIAAEDNLNKRLHQYRDSNGEIVTLNMQLVRYIRVQPDPLAL